MSITSRRRFGSHTPPPRNVLLFYTEMQMQARHLSDLINGDKRMHQECLNPSRATYVTRYGVLRSVAKCLIAESVPSDRSPNLDE